MKFTSFLRIFALALVCYAVPGQSAARHPNIVFIMADDLGYGDIGPFGQKIIRTPSLDRMAGEGMRFTQHYAGNQVCAPSRCVLMTGKHPGHAFVRDNHEIGAWESLQGQLPIPENEVTFAQVLQKWGYVAGAFGKWGLGGVGTSGDPLKHGFVRFYGYNDQRHAHNYYPEVLVSDSSLVNLDNPKIKIPAGLPKEADANDAANYKSFSGKQYAPDLIAEQALKFIRENKERPFLLYFPTTVPHLSLQVPEDSVAEYRDQLGDKPYRGGKGYLPHQYPRAAYAGMVTRMDREIGRLAQLIAELGLDDNTIFIFTSDNGAVFPLGGTDPEYFNSTGGLRGYKGSMYEGGVRSPLIVRWKGHIKAQSTSDLVTGFEDWFPTLLELTGVTNAAPANLDGLSFAPTLLGKTQPARAFLYRESPGYGGQLFARMGDWKLVKTNLAPKGNTKAKLTTELFNLAADPTEKKDVASAHPDIIAKLENLIREQHRKSSEFPLPALDGPKAK